MAFDFIKKIFKWLFSALSRDASLQKREEKIEKKEEVESLDVEIDEKKVSENANKALAGARKIFGLESQLIYLVQGLKADVQQFLSNQEVVPEAEERLEKLATKFKDSEKWWEQIIKNLAKAIDFSKKAEGALEKSKEKLIKEKRFLNKEYRNLKRSFRKKKELDQEKKEAIIETKKEINRQMLVLVEENLHLVREDLNLLEELHYQNQNLLDRVPNLEKELNVLKGNWKKLERWLGKIEKFVKVGEKLANSIESSEPQFLKTAERSEEIEKEVYNLVKHKQDLDKVYKSLLIKEEAKVQQEKPAVKKAA